MKHVRSLFVVVALIALSVGLALIREQTTQTATAARDSQSSTGAPTFAPGDSLSQALADLLAAGYEIKHVDGLTYTLVRQ